MLKNAICRITVIDSEQESVRFYRETLGLQFDLHVFESIAHLQSSIESGQRSVSDLIIVDPVDPQTETDDLESFLKFRESMKNHGVEFQHFVVASGNRELKAIRSYFQLGACEFLSKPFARDEVIVRIETALSRIRGQQIAILESVIDGVQIENLTYREHQILTVLLNHSGNHISRRKLLEAVWAEVTVHHKTLDVHLFNLRRKLRPNGYDIVFQDQMFGLCKLDS